MRTSPIGFGFPTRKGAPRNVSSAVPMRTERIDSTFPLRNVSRLLRLLRPVRAFLPGALLASALVAGSQAAYAYLVGPVLRFVFTGETSSWLPSGLLSSGGALTLAATIVCVSVVKGVATFFAATTSERVGQAVSFDLRRRVYDRLLCLPADFFSGIGRGDLVTRSTSDVDFVKHAVTDGLSTIARDSLQAVALVAVAVSVDPWMSLFAVVGFPPVALLAAAIGRRVRAAHARALAEDGALADAVTDAAVSAAAIRSYEAAGSLRERFARRSDALRRATVHAVALQASGSPVVELLGALALGGGIVYARLRIVEGSLSPDHFLSFFAAVLLLYRPLKGLGLTGTMLQSGIAALDRIDEVLRAPPEPPDADDATDAPPLREAIEIDGVSVRRGGEEVLDDVRLRLAAGQVVAVVGTSGAGKSTLAALLLRLVEPDRGTLRWDGVDVRRFRRASLRRHFALVTQEPLLLRDTVRANVTFGSPDGDVDAVWRAIDMAGARPLVEGLPAGLETVLGEGGGQISGGERQRLCLARAFYRDPSVLVLDEATSSLDSESEVALRGALAELTKGRTALLVAHRLATVRDADRIVVIEDGRIVEEGRHADLWGAAGPYRRIFADQG